jgi:uncharacterized protein
MASSAGFHESEERLTPATRDLHRALVSLQEELEAIDWYQQRIDAVQDDELREILQHNRDEELEHAAMLLEWVRRHHPSVDEALRPRLFRDGPIVGREKALEKDEALGAQDNGGGEPATRHRPTVGSLRDDQSRRHA